MSEAEAYVGIDVSKAELEVAVEDSGWGGVRSQGPHRSPEDVHSRRVLRSGAGTILLSGTLWPIASFGSPGVHSL